MRRPLRSMPGVTRLEGRLLPTAAPYPDAARTAIHESYVAEAQSSPSDVVFLGDSITYLWGDSQRSSLGSATWQADFGPLGAENFGVSGDQTQNLLYRVQDGELDGKPKVAVVLIGINDLLGGESPTETAQGITSVVTSIRAKSPGTDVLLLGVLPTASMNLNGDIAQVNAQIAHLSGTPGVEFLNPGLEFLGAGGVDRPGLLAFGVHPGPDGYAILGQAIDGPIEAILHPPVAAKPAAKTEALATPATPATPDVLIPNVGATADATASPAADDTPVRHKSASSVSPTL